MSVSASSEYAVCLPATWLAERLATDPLRIEAMRRDGELIAVRKPGSLEWLYPAWQLEHGRPRPGVVRVVSAARERGIDEERLFEILTARLGMSGPRRRLADLLREGREDDVVAAIRTA